MRSVSKLFNFLTAVGIYDEWKRTNVFNVLRKRYVRGFWIS